MQCKKCDKAFDNIQSLRAHQKVHKDGSAGGLPKRSRGSAESLPGKSQTVAGDPRDVGRVRRGVVQTFSVDVERINSEAEAARAKAKKIEAEIDLREAQKKKERMEAREEEAQQQPEITIDDSGEASALQSILQTHGTILLKLLERDGDRGKGPSTAELIAAIGSLLPKADPLDTIKKLQELTPKSGVDFESFLKGVEFAKSNLPDGGGEKESFWSKALASALERLPAAIPALMGGLAAIKSGGNPAAVAAASAGAGAAASPTSDLPFAATAEERARRAEQMLPGVLADLKERARKRQDPQTIADWVTENSDQPDYQNVVSILLNRPFESFGKVDPEIMQEPLRAWFLSLYTRLKQNFSPPDDEGANAGQVAVGSPGQGAR